MLRKISLLIAAASFASQSWAVLDLSLDFELDTANSSVTVDDSCIIGFCSVDAELADGFGGSFALGVGDSYEFDFITWTAEGFGIGEFDVEATLAFVTPTMATTTADGGGGFGVLGTLSGGVLHWNNLPNNIILNDGSEISIDFQGGIGISGSEPITSTATVTVNSIGRPVSVPEPGMVSLLALGLLGLGIARRQNA